MTIYQPYYNENEFRPVKNMKNCPERVQCLKAMADAGNIQAAYVYGDMLMIGGWDIKRIEADLVRGKLAPPVKALSDRYLILPRNQNLAIEYLKIAANYPCENVCTEVSEARAILHCCRTKSNIGYYGSGKLDSFMLEHYFKYVNSSASVSDKLANPFFPLPYGRPEVENPKTKVFDHIAFKMTIVSVIQILFYLMLSYFASYFPLMFAKKSNIEQLVFEFVTFTFFAFMAPVIIVLIIVKIYGSTSPLCTCAEIRKAYGIATADLPEELKRDDPFEQTPSIVRNVISIELGLFGIYAIIGIILAVIKYADLFNIASIMFFISESLINSVIIILIIAPLPFFFVLKKVERGLVDRFCDLELCHLEKK